MGNTIGYDFRKKLLNDVRLYKTAASGVAPAQPVQKGQDISYYDSPDKLNQWLNWGYGNARDAFVGQQFAADQQRAMANGGAGGVQYYNNPGAIRSGLSKQYGSTFAGQVNRDSDENTRLLNEHRARVFAGVDPNKVDEVGDYQMSQDPRYAELMRLKEQARANTVSKPQSLKDAEEDAASGWGQIWGGVKGFFGGETANDKVNRESKSWHEKSNQLNRQYQKMRDSIKADIARGQDVVSKYDYLVRKGDYEAAEQLLRDPANAAALKDNQWASQRISMQNGLNQADMDKYWDDKANKMGIAYDRATTTRNERSLLFEGRRIFQEQGEKAYQEWRDGVMQQASQKGSTVVLSPGFVQALNTDFRKMLEQKQQAGTAAQPAPQPQPQPQTTAASAQQQQQQQQAAGTGTAANAGNAAAAGGTAAAATQQNAGTVQASQTAAPAANVNTGANANAGTAAAASGSPAPQASQTAQTAQNTGTGQQTQAQAQEGQAQQVTGTAQPQPQQKPQTQVQPAPAVDSRQQHMEMRNNEKTTLQNKVNGDKERRSIPAQPKQQTAASQPANTVANGYSGTGMKVITATGTGANVKPPAVKPVSTPKVSSNKSKMTTGWSTKVRPENTVRGIKSSAIGNGKSNQQWMHKIQSAQPAQVPGVRVCPACGSTVGHPAMPAGNGGQPCAAQQPPPQPAAAVPAVAQPAQPQARTYGDGLINHAPRKRFADTFVW